MTDRFPPLTIDTESVGVPQFTWAGKEGGWVESTTYLDPTDPIKVTVLIRRFDANKENMLPIPAEWGLR